MKNNKNLKKLVVSALFAALIFLMTFVVKVPVASGYVHFGDALLYLCACIVGGPWAVFAGAIGEGLADLAGGYAMYIPATAIIKAVMAIPLVIVCAKKEKILSVQSVLFTVLGGVITVGGYFAADMIIDKSYAVADIPGNVIQAVGSIVIFVVLALAFDKMGIKKKLK